jgi:hypothetical protein
VPGRFRLRFWFRAFTPFLFETGPGWLIVSRRAGKPLGTLEQEKVRRATGASTGRGFTAQSFTRNQFQETSRTRFFSRRPCASTIDAPVTKREHP